MLAHVVPIDSVCGCQLASSHLQPNPECCALQVSIALVIVQVNHLSFNHAVQFTEAELLVKNGLGL